VVDLYCDAAGGSSKLAAVLQLEDKFFYTAMDTPRDLLGMFIEREDSQIMGIELLAIVLGGTFSVASLSSGGFVSALCFCVLHLCRHWDLYAGHCRMHGQALD